MAKAKQSEESYESKTTTDHEEIRRWVEERGGHPARVEGTNLLRIDYPGFSGEQRLEEISWDEFFEIFDENNLKFLYQENTKDGGKSRFSKLVGRDSVE
jgi:anaerobic selenocysteine-containing dehydrogenase